MFWEQQVEYAVLSDIGFRRQNNQDSYAVQIAPNHETFERRGHLFLVADGMGGHAVGELASKMAADAIPHTYHKAKTPIVPDALRTAILGANGTIHDRGLQNEDFLRMGTTCTTLVLSPEGAIAGHVGDSRLYRIRRDAIDQLTFDHSLQWELLKQGKMPAEEILLNEPRHVITRCLGPEPYVEVDIEGFHAVFPGDTFLLCSDGLSGLVKDSEIGTIAAHLPPAEACQLLVNLANLRGGSDNITVLIVRVGDLPQGMDSGDRPTRQKEQRGVAWGWLAAVWGVAILLVGAASLYLLEHKVEGIAVFATFLVSFVLLVWAWMKQKRPPDDPAMDVTISSPYRTASANLTKKLTSHLVAVENELQQAAMEEGWPIDWKEHGACYREAKSELDRKRFSQAMRAYARVVHILMTALQQQRREQKRTAKWGPRVIREPPADG